VLLNGVPGKVFHCKRGVRQGDPLSPLLFVLAADLLQSVINKARINQSVGEGLISIARNQPKLPGPWFADQKNRVGLEF
jgi:hypothetical protein